VKKAIILVVLLVAFATPAAAQTDPIFGAKVGINFATLSFDPEDPEEVTETRTAFTVGALMIFPMNARFAFQPEVLYSSQGAKGESEGIDAQIKLDYINIPLLANINLSGGDYPISLLVGPQLGFRTSAKFKVEEAGTELEEDVKDQIESFDFGLVTGVSATIRNFLIDARYTWGLSNISKLSINPLEEDEQEAKNRVFTISVGYLFR
jgi:outer membrane protein with beta-barrel domain